MKRIITQTQEDKQNIKNLLNKEIPSYRQAYSDRTAWIMSCLSELAYIKFNPLFSGNKKKYFLEKILQFINESKKKSLLKLIDIVGYDHEEELKTLKSELISLKLELIKTFDQNGTQAILVKSNKFIALAFRGTEATSIKDIKTDINALQTHSGDEGKIHQGFKEAFDNVAMDIETVLEEFPTLPLFLTGHSLGGALATIATKKIKHKGGIAACYTFGSPRVGDVNWSLKIKSPIYRLVNAADAITMLPFGHDFISILSWVLKFTPICGKWIQLKMGGYHHCGDMRYLSNCKTGNYNNVKLLNAVSFWFRLKGYILTKVWGKLLSDHYINTYRKKLMIVAIRRNKL